MFMIFDFARCTSISEQYLALGCVHIKLPEMYTGHQGAPGTVQEDTYRSVPGQNHISSLAKPARGDSQQTHSIFLDLHTRNT